MNNFFIRLLIVLIVGFFVIAGASNAPFSTLINGCHDRIANRLASELAQKMVQNAAVLEHREAPALPPRKSKRQKKGKSSDASDNTVEKASERKEKPGLPKDSLLVILE